MMKSIDELMLIATEYAVNGWDWEDFQTDITARNNAHMVRKGIIDDDDVMQLVWHIVKMNRLFD